MTAWEFDGQDQISLEYVQDQFRDIELHIEENPDSQLAKELTVLKKRWKEEFKCYMSQQFNLSETIDDFLAAVGIREE